MPLPTFLRLSSVEGVPQDTAEVLHLDDPMQEAWLLVHCGPEFIMNAVVGDYVRDDSHHMDTNYVIIKLGNEWSWDLHASSEALRRRGRLKLATWKKSKKRT
jgi:hypothetical protein